MKKNTTKELGEMLYELTYDMTKTYFETTKEKELDRLSWAWLHTGFIAGLKVAGYTHEERMKVIKNCQKHLQDHDDRCDKGESI